MTHFNKLKRKVSKCIDIKLIPSSVIHTKRIMKITQNKINKKIITKFEQINTKLNSDNCFMEGDYFEGYIVQADVTKEEAYWAMRLIDFKDCLEDEPENGVQRDWLEAVRFYMGGNSEEGDKDGWWYLKPGRGRKFMSKGWIARY